MLIKMSFKIEYFDSVPFKGTCILSDNALKTRGGSTLTFPATGGTLATTDQLTPADLSDYALKSEIPAAVDLTNYATKSEVPSLVDLSDYALKSELPDGAAEVDLSGIESDVQTISTAVSGMTSTLSTISSNVSTANTNIGTINTNIGTINSNVSTISSNVSSINSSVSSMKTSVSTMQTKVNNLESNFTTALIKAAHPVGSIMAVYNNNNPKTAFTGYNGTTWSLVSNSGSVYFFRRTA